MSSIFVAIIVAGLIPLILMYPAVGILGWFWISLMNPHRVVWGPATDLSYAAIIGGTTLVAWMVSKEPKRLPSSGAVWLLVLFGLWITWTTTQAIVPEAAWQIWDRSIKILLMTLVTIALMHTRERIHALVWIVTLSLGYFAIKGGLFTIATGGQHHVLGPPQSFIGDNNHLALAVLMAAPMFRYLQLQSGMKWIRWGAGVGLALFAFAAIGSQSRGAFLALIAMAAFLVWKSRYRARIAVLTVALAFVAAWFVPESWVERMQTIQDYEEDNSALSRLQSWGWAIDLANERPFRGGGFEVYRHGALYMSMVPEASKPRNFHSIYFEMLGMHGYIGLVLFLLILFVTWQSFSRTIRLARGREDLTWALDLAKMCQVSMVAYMVGGAFVNQGFYDLYYVLVAIAILLRQYVQQAQPEHGAARIRESSRVQPVPAAAHAAGRSPMTAHRHRP